jgi:hypothetical protein
MQNALNAMANESTATAQQKGRDLQLAAAIAAAIDSGVPIANMISAVVASDTVVTIDASVTGGDTTYLPGANTVTIDATWLQTGGQFAETVGNLGHELGHAYLDIFAPGPSSLQEEAVLANQGQLLEQAMGNNADVRDLQNPLVYGQSILDAYLAQYAWFQEGKLNNVAQTVAPDNRFFAMHDLLGAQPLTPHQNGIIGTTVRPALPGPFLDE